MKNMFGALGSCLVMYCAVAAPPDSFTDPRDQQIYGVANAGGLRWMTENLRYATQSSACYDDLEDNCKKLGRLYPWEVALQACPDGWHLSTEYEWQLLELSLGVPFEELAGENERGDLASAGNKIKSSGSRQLKFPFAGYADPDRKFLARGETAAIWTASEADFNHAWHRDLDVGRTGIYRSRVYKPWLLSVRCVQNHFETSPEHDEED